MDVERRRHEAGKATRNRSPDGIRREGRRLGRASPAASTALLMIGLSALILNCNVTREGIVVEMTPEEIQQKLDRAFPITEKYLMVFSLTLADPEVELVEGSDRIGFGLSAKTNVRVSGKDVTGRAKMSTGLRYDPAKGALFLADPRVEGIKMSMLPEEYEDDVRLAANLAAGKFLKEYEVYRLDESDFKQAIAKMTLKNVVVQDGVLKLVFGLGNQ